MADKQFIHAVARIRSKELALFSKQTIDQLMSCRTYEDCMKMLADKGWGTFGNSAEQMLKEEREKIWKLMQELVEDMSVFDVLLYTNDYHNLKAAIKQACVSETVPDIYMENGTVAVDIIKTAVNEKQFELLPVEMRECAADAFEIQLKTRDSQLSDVILDRACLEAIYKKAMESDVKLYKEYAELKVAVADINIAIRSFLTGKSIDFLKKALIPCKSLDLKTLTDAVLAGEESIFEYLLVTKYSDAVPALKKSMSAFERWCDNKLIELISPEKYNSFTISPLAAYVLARENEIKSVRILLSGKLNYLPEDSIRERLREMYV